MSTDTHRRNANRRLVLEDDQMYTVAETAELLSLTERQIKRLRIAKRLGCVRTSGASVRHHGSQIRAFIEAASENAE